MKLIAPLLTTFCMLLTASLCSQDITLSLKNVSLQDALQAIEKQTDYRFVYVKEQIEKAGLVTMDVKQVGLETALRQCFEGQPLSYVIEDRLVIVRNKQQTKDQPVLHDIKGRVTNKEGTPLAGITVRVKGKDIATATEGNGEFSLKDVSPSDILIFSGAEVETRELSINGNHFVSIALTQKVQDLDETLIIGYGTTTRRFSVGSITKVAAKDIGLQPVSNPLAALQGRVPGLVVTNTSGIPGASINIQIRGQNSLNPNPDRNSGIPPLDNPLIIIDGVTFAPQNESINQFNSLASPGVSGIFGNAYGGLSPLNNINPADIESIEILRDANETAIYGSRGANGVVLITTKKGRPGKTALSLNIRSGMSKVARSMRMMHTSEYLAMRRESLNNDGLEPSMTPSRPGYAPDLLRFDTTRSVDWKAYFLGGTAHTTDFNVNLSGGTANLQFLVGAGYQKEGFIIPGDFKNERGSFNSNLRHHSADNRFSFDLTVHYSYNGNNSSGSPDALKAFTLAPNYPELMDPDGNLIWMYNGVILFDNPLAYLRQKYVNNTRNLLGHLTMGYEVWKGLKISANLGYNSFNGKEQSTIPKSSQHPLFDPVAYGSFGSNDYSSFSVEPQIEYAKTIGKGKLTLLVGGAYQMNTTSLDQVTGSGYSDDELLNSISGASDVYAFNEFREYKYAGVFGRANYKWNNKYIVNFNGRRDGSSRFGPGKQFGNFGAFGLGWIFSEESFIKNGNNGLSFGKLRMSLGTTGNDNIGDYKYLARWAPSSFRGLSFEGRNAYSPSNHYNPDFSWSLTRKFEAGLELGWWEDRLLFSATWYKHRSSNQLVTYRLPNQTGFGGVTANFPAVVQNSGWEFSVGSAILNGEALRWNTAFNITFPKNLLLEFEGLEQSSYATVYVKGKSLSTLNKFAWAGVDPNTGTYQYHSKSGLTHNPESIVDWQVSGNLDPKFYGGLSNRLEFKNIALDVFIEFRKQTGPNYLQQLYFNGAVGGYRNMADAIGDHWRKPGDKANIQRLTAYRYAATETSLAALNFGYSDGAYSDASYIRLKTIGISYGLHPLVTKKLRLQDARFYINAQNVLTITKYKGHDPETMSFYSLPILRTIVAGIKLTI